MRSFVKEVADMFRNFFIAAALIYAGVWVNYAEQVLPNSVYASFTGTTLFSELFFTILAILLLLTGITLGVINAFAYTLSAIVFHRYDETRTAHKIARWILAAAVMCIWAYFFVGLLLLAVWDADNIYSINQ